MSRSKSDASRFDSDAQPDPASGAPLLQVRGLRVAFPSENGRVHAVRGVDLDVRVQRQIRFRQKCGTLQQV